VRRRVPSGFTLPEATIVLLGETKDEFGGSLWAWLRHDHLGGRPPTVDLHAERSLADVLVAAAAGQLIVAAHDLSDGGLALALAEACLTGDIGCSLTLPGDPATFLFSESSARAVVAVRPGAEVAFGQLCAANAVPTATVGRTGGAVLEIAGLFAVPLSELAELHRSALPALFG
jgi:phosphoribosylformylglycinamidine synthase subunit PurL